VSIGLGMLRTLNYPPLRTSVSSAVDPTLVVVLAGLGLVFTICLSIVLDVIVPQTATAPIERGIARRRPSAGPDLVR
jgi:hypothetical protein